MGDPNATSSSTPSPPPSSTSALPPGCRFYPSEEQLLCYYLHHKTTNTLTPHDTIKEVNLYDYNPFDLPEITCFRFGFRGRQRHWYCYTELLVDGGDRERRRAGFGFWKRKGRVRDVVGVGGAGKVVLGRRKCFVFYLDKNNHGRKKKCVKTDWIMYEYALVDNLKASFVVCRVFVKSRGRRSLSEHALSSCAEESYATVRHIGIQHDGSTISVLAEGKSHLRDYANEKTAEPTRLVEEMQPENLVTSHGLASSSSMLVDTVTARHLVSILEGDFIELDDLV